MNADDDHRHDAPPRASSRISVVRGDITRQHVDAIVNAANTAPLGGTHRDGPRAAAPAVGRKPRSEGSAFRMRRWVVGLMAESRCRYYRRSFGDVPIFSTMAAA
jgi:hypothetical protein